jgi:protoheme ferro-lyase
MLRDGHRWHEASTTNGVHQKGEAFIEGQDVLWTAKIGTRYHLSPATEKVTNQLRKETQDSHDMSPGYLMNEDDMHIETIDEIKDFLAGSRQKKTVFLYPRYYVLFCNIPRQ